MYYTGFADEAADDIYGQIKATLELGWTHIECRNVNKKSLHELSDEEFDTVVDALEKNQVSINCVGSPIANWGRSVLDPFENTLDEILRTIPRMRRLRIPQIRIMSYGIIKDRSPSDQYEEERFRRVRQIKQMFEDEGIVPVHENCMNYGGMSSFHMLRLIENVPGLKVVFDTGNPPFTDDRSMPEPYPKQSSWEFYSQIKEHIEYVHIKDCKYITENETGVFPKAQFTFPGEGDGDVERILMDLVQSGYDGGLSIEPHLSKVFHESDENGKSLEERMYSSYIEYGQRLMQLVEPLRCQQKQVVGS